MELLGSIFDHLVLPPKLPGQQDADIEGIGAEVLARLIRACDTIAKSTGHPLTEAWNSLHHSLRVCRALNLGRLEKATMLAEFCNLQEKTVLILYVEEQNAALFVRRHASGGIDTVIFEVFEVSPSSESVLAAEGALQWDFPERAVEIPFHEFIKESFQESLATFLEQASMESLTRFKALSAKAKTSVIEARDTPDPSLITRMLIPLLEAVGSSTDVPTVRKRVRDDVNIQNAEFPWRRLPFWLVLRVASQRQLCLALEVEAGRACYKFLICTLLAQLLEDCAGQLAPELTVLVRAKLCRRLAKLEIDKTHAGSAPAIYEQLFSTIGSMLKKVIEKATEQVESAWANYKSKIARPIPALPLRAPEYALHLSLPNSQKYLNSLLSKPRTQQKCTSRLDVPLSCDGTIDKVTKLTDRYFKLAEIENFIEGEQKSVPNTTRDCEALCCELAELITGLFTLVGDAYDSNPEQTSIFALTLFDLWVQMDTCAVKACPLLGDYCPLFQPGLLDALHLPRLSSMHRLKDTQRYLSSRSSNCKFAHKTAFSELDENCFAVRYVEQSTRLQNLQEKIEEDSRKLRQKKRAEWENACKEYDSLSVQISSGVCICTTNPDGSRNVDGCKKCWRWRRRNRMRIAIHEDFLPATDAKKAAVVFELEIPDYLAAYRNATFKIFRNLTYPGKPKTSSSPTMLLKDYSQLKHYMKSTGTSFSLASAKKSFLQTHYKELKMRVDDVSKVLLPLALDFAYYDTESRLWLKDLEKQPTLQHLCGIHIPRSLLASTIRPSEHPTPGIDGPSSYEIITSQSKCPSDISIHEFTVYQRLLSGKARRWLSMLVELGASNLNFGAEDTMHVYSHLAVQAGPAKNEVDVLRDSHLVFQDERFCQRLTEQIDNRLRNITTNWREIHCMEMLITLSLRLFELTSGGARQSAEALLKAARVATLQWILRLRNELRGAAVAAAADRAAKYGFWAALLCRRTFTTFAESDTMLNAEDLYSFVQASVALQENLVVDLAELPLNLKNMLVRDAKMAYRIGSLIEESIRSNPDSLGAAINKILSDSDNFTDRTYSPWQFLSLPNERWVGSIIASKANGFILTQVIHYNFIEGHLLVDGKPLGRLPLDIRESEDVKDLFENQHLLTFPSPLSGMTHVMANRICGNEIHFGLRGNQVIIQTLVRDDLLEYVPRRVFMVNGSPDLPFGLIENCVHWLNLRTKCLEIRRKPTVWKSRRGDWILDVLTRQVQRKRVLLVDPHSNICKRVAAIFRHFEDSSWLTVFQPTKGTLSVEMRRLELSFFVNNKHLLECRELHAEIDPNQDAGTLYGFQSKIVLRDLSNTDRRSIITALGPLTFERHGMHIAVQAGRVAEYGKFRIDDVLGRLSCPPEPRLLFLKAQFHAFTSFVLPDPLTGRTGAEEALHTLKSGHCQPWASLAAGPVSILKVIKGLSPSREYYPRDRKRLQSVLWDQRLNMSIQHDSYENLVQAILSKSDKLKAFSVYGESTKDFEPEIPSFLRKRGEIRRRLYDRGTSDLDVIITGEDVMYKSRHRQANLLQASNVYQIVRILCKQPLRIHMKRELAAILQDWDLIGGFHPEANSESISSCLNDLIESSIGEQWGSLINFCQKNDAQRPYELIFRLSLLSFAQNPEMDAIRSLAAFGCLDELKALQQPSGLSFTGFKLHASPTLESLLDFILADCPVSKPISKRLMKKQNLAQEKQRILYETEGRRLALFLLEQWPNSEPSAEGFESTVIDVQPAMERIRPDWERLHQNIALSEYVGQAQRILDRHKGDKDISTIRVWSENPATIFASSRGSIIPSISKDLLLKCGPLPRSHAHLNHESLPGEYLPPLAPPSEKSNTSRSATPQKEFIELGKIFGSFSGLPDALRQKYGNDLEKSLMALENSSNEPRLQEATPVLSVVREDVETARATLKFELERIQNAFSANDDRFKWLQLGSLWPCTSPVTILEQLRSSANHQFGDSMKESLVTYGVLITALQKLLRVRNAQLKEDNHKLLEEWRNTGHENWSPLEFPDWLLLEIESDILIRCEQVDVAHAIMSPASGSNSLLQMNMGKGKTSCIVPMVAAILANKKQLLRVIVPKALLLQTAQTVQSRLGGLVGREIRHIPFSRRSATTSSMLQLYSDLHREILQGCGIIITIPDHVLSYKLSGLQRLVDSRLKEAKEMVEFQSWLTSTCRDVLDESDFTLAVKTQLIYPSGPQISVDGYPHRWEVAQSILSLVEDHLADLQRIFPRSIEVAEQPYGFPMLHFLQTDVEDAMRCRIIDDICDGRVSFLRFSGPTSSVSKLDIKRVLSEENVDPKLVKRVSRFFVDRSSAHKNILLIRGLLLNKILLACLKKRWNVQYGLHPKRPPIAVPFEAKGIPSDQAEFGHPDVSILFTCLAFYYSGLTSAQFGESLQRVLKVDDPAAEYDRWTSSSVTIPEALCHWNLINPDDQGQVEELWHHLRLNRYVLNYYMNNFVFPVHAKQFGVKLQASGWDLPLFSRSELREKATCANTTGFSGTNDNKMMLPLNITQDDLPSLHQTNAEVLTYILQDRNRKYRLAAQQGKRLTEEGLLRTMAQMEIRILIDAGAYILEMDNRTLVKSWLDMDPQAKGAVFFGADNRAWVLYRGGKSVLPLLATPFAENLDTCLVYIDEAHTRGIDLKLPQKARGALTLALGQTKDHTVQAAMRLRQLGTTQSVVFFAPPEVNQSILDVCMKLDGEVVDPFNIDSSHVVAWLLEQTCRANENLQNLYIAQGTDFCRRTNSQWKNVNLFTNKSQREDYLKSIQQPERQTLEQLYGKIAGASSISAADVQSVELKGYMRELRKHKLAAVGSGSTIQSSVLEEVEQEREVEFQVEEVRQVQKPTHYKALTFPGLHPAISHFAWTGEIFGEHNFEQAFDALARTSIGQKYNVCNTMSRLYVSTEFMRTIELDSAVPNDSFLRPVEWILWSPLEETALIIIPEEAELLIPILRAVSRPKAHLIAYAAPVTKNMLHFNGLLYYNLPALHPSYEFPEWLSIELGIFAGRLYVNFSECASLKDYLQLADMTNFGATESNNGQRGVFTKNPANFLLEWLALRRKGQNIVHTPMGYICQGRPLREDHSFFTRRGEVRDILVPTVRNRTNEEADEDPDQDSDVEYEWNLDDDSTSQTAGSPEILDDA